VILRPTDVSFPGSIPEAALMEPTVSTTDIAPLDFVRALEQGAPLHLIDVRLAERVAAGRIDLVPQERFHNILGSKLLPRTNLDGITIGSGERAVVVCGHGNTSQHVAAHLRALGLDAVSLRGGMAAYTDLLVDRPITPPASLDRLVQFDRIGKGSLAYLLVSGNEAFIVDPPRDARPILAAATAAGAHVVGVADTHVHADYVSGAQALASRLGVPYWLHPADNVFPFDGTPGRLAIRPLADGATIPLGRATIVARHTPGHTEGSTSFAIEDAAILTGDFVFVDSLGRPDLAGRAAEWAVNLWESLVRARSTWPADALVLPAHYSSERERRADRAIAATFGEIARTNAAVQMTDRDAFIAWATAPSSVPAAYRTLKAINAGLKLVSDDEAAELEVGRSECAVSKPAGA
jgi:glyoxylase-like metal-dependent hydrolase (beta-lactamase superfamily II)/rhodanese-related sulfurtransferase